MKGRRQLQSSVTLFGCPIITIAKKSRNRQMGQYDSPLFVKTLKRAVVPHINNSLRKL
jgi:hypothetical protein